MRRIAGTMMAGLIGSLLVSSVARAQVSVYVAGGPTFPTGEYGTYAKTGWLAAAGVGVSVASVKGLSFGGEFVYGSNKHDGAEGDKTNLPGVFGYAEYRVGDEAKPGVYFFGQAGMLNHQYKPGASAGYSGDSEWKFAVGGGAGVDIPAGGVSIFVEARYLTRSGTNLVPVLVGVAVPVGSKR